MIRFILVTFLFLGWAFYELSGGSTFEPEERVVADAGDVEEAAAAEVVTRSTDPVMDTLAVPERLTEALIETPQEDPVAAPAVAEIEAVVEEVAAEATGVVAPVVDLRAVAGSRVNMRTGPGTNFSVVTTLDGGTHTEVLESDPSGWVRLRVVSSGVEGWMAERLLTPVEG